MKQKTLVILTLITIFYLLGPYLSLRAVPVIIDTTVRNQLIDHDPIIINFFPKLLEEAQAKGIAIDAPLNAHWNSNGHSLAGEIILNYLIEHDLLNKK